MFYLNPIPFNGQDQGNQKERGTSCPLLSRSKNKFIKIHLLVMYYKVQLNRFMICESLGFKFP